MGGRPGRGEHPQQQWPEASLLACPRRVHRYTLPLRRGDRCGQGRWARVVARAFPHGMDIDGVEHRRAAPGVVGVGVGEHEQVEVRRAVAAEPGRSVAVPTGVHQHRDVTCRQQERIALPHIDRSEHEGATGRSRGRDDHDRTGQHDGCCSHACDGGPCGSHEPHHDRDGQDQHDRGAEPDGRPPPLQRTSRPQHPRQGRRGQTEQHDRQARQRDGDGGRSGAQHRGGSGQRDRDEVGRDGRQPHLLPRAQQHREHRHLGAQRDREQVQQPTRADHGLEWPQPRPDPGRDQQHPQRRSRREQHAEASGQQGVEQDQHQHRAGQGMQGQDAPAAGLGQQHHQGHGTGSQHRGVGAREQREHQHNDHCEATSTASSETGGTGDQPRPRDDQGHVGPRHRGQVRQAGGPHRLVIGRRQQGGVAGDQSGRQAGRTRRQGLGGDRGQ